jgi:hypothetical protein
MNIMDRGVRHGLLDAVRLDKSKNGQYKIAFDKYPISCQRVSFPEADLCKMQATAAKKKKKPDHAMCTSAEPDVSPCACLEYFHFN